MDVLSDAIWSARLGHPTSDTARLTAPWCVQMTPYDGLAFLAVTRGSFWILPDAGEPVRAGEGDIVLMLSRGGRYVLADSRPADRCPIERAMSFDAWRRQDGMKTILEQGPLHSHDVTEVLCGKYRLESAGLHPFLTTLPQFTVLARETGIAPELRSALDWLSSAQADRRQGSTAVLRGILDLIFVALVRAAAERRLERTAMVSVGDAAVAAALRAIDANPSAPWTSGRLAQAAGVSRPTLTRRFSEHLGVAPMAYVTRTRLTRAAHLLVGTSRTLSAIALAVGYGSPYSFSHAFTKQYGMSPGRFRSHISTQTGA